MPDASVVLDELPTPLLILRDGEVIGASPGTSELLGVDPGHLVGIAMTELVDPVDRPGLAVLLEQAGPGPHDTDDPASEAAGPIDVRTAPPARRPLRIAVRARSDGSLLVALRDLALERRLTAIIHAVADSTLLVDPDGRSLWHTDDLWPSTAGETVSLGTHPVERLHPEDLPLVLEAFSTLSDMPGGRVDRVVRARAVGEEDVWQLIELIGASRVADPDLGGVVVQVRTLDVDSELASLGHSEGPMLSLAEAAPVGILLMNHLEQVMYASGACRSLLAYDLTEDVSGWRDRAASTHRGDIDALVAEGLSGAPSTTITSPFDLPDGNRLWMRVRVASHLDTRGEPLGAIVSLEDVTAEVEARTESERLLHMLDNTSDFVAIFRPNGDILHTNAALAQLLADNLASGGTGRLGDLLEDRERFIRLGLAAVESVDTWQGEIRLAVSPARIVPVSVTGVVHRDDDGDLDWIAMVARDISDLKEAEQRLRRLATSDHLTGLANRALFTEQLEEVVARAASTGRTVAVLFCDLDRFKEVNDQHGHAVGDRVLVEIADRLCAIVRGDDLVARVGGDEFVILCDGTADPEMLAQLADRVISTVHAPIVVDDVTVQVGISIGVAMGGSVRVSGDRLLTIADQAMYRAKATGGNRYRILEVGDE